MNVKRFVNGVELPKEELKNYVLEDETVLKTMQAVNQRIAVHLEDGKISRLESE